MGSTHQQKKKTPTQTPKPAAKIAGSRTAVEARDCCRPRRGRRRLRTGPWCTATTWASSSRKPHCCVPPLCRPDAMKKGGTQTEFWSGLGGMLAWLAFRGARPSGPAGAARGGNDCRAAAIAARMLQIGLRSPTQRRAWQQPKRAHHRCWRLPYQQEARPTISLPWHRPPRPHPARPPARPTSAPPRAPTRALAAVLPQQPLTIRSRHCDTVDDVRPKR